MRIFCLTAMAILAALTGCSREQAAEELPMDVAPTEVIERSAPDKLANGFSKAASDQCIAAGGTYRQAGRAARYNCIMPFADAGRTCRAASDCEGQCRVDMKAEEGAAGKCQENDNRFGCYAYLDDNGEKLAICVD